MKYVSPFSGMEAATVALGNRSVGSLCASPSSTSSPAPFRPSGTAMYRTSET